MKYKIGDKVKIKEDLVVDNTYGGDTYLKEMDDIAKDNDYVLTIGKLNHYIDEYEMDEDERDDPWFWTDAMIEGLAELTDRQKFEGWMRKLSSLKSDDRVWNAFNYCVTAEPDTCDYEDELKIISDYLFAKKKMTKAEIEAELGYKIEIVEE